jgi:hypothetical protein
MGGFWSLAPQRLRAYMCGRLEGFNMTRAASAKCDNPESAFCARFSVCRVIVRKTGSHFFASRYKASAGDAAPAPALATSAEEAKEAAVEAERREDLPPAAVRALEEADARRRAAETPGKKQPKEIGGPTGPEPTRYGDWERGGRAVDF